MINTLWPHCMHSLLSPSIERTYVSGDTPWPGEKQPCLVHSRLPPFGSVEHVTNKAQWQLNCQSVMFSQSVSLCSHFIVNFSSTLSLPTFTVPQCGQFVLCILSHMPSPAMALATGRGMPDLVRALLAWVSPASTTLAVPPGVWSRHWPTQDPSAAPHYLLRNIPAPLPGIQATLRSDPNLLPSLTFHLATANLNSTTLHKNGSVFHLCCLPQNVFFSWNDLPLSPTCQNRPHFLPPDHMLFSLSNPKWLSQPKVIFLSLPYYNTQIIPFMCSLLHVAFIVIVDHTSACSIQGLLCTPPTLSIILNQPARWIPLSVVFVVCPTSHS